MALSRQQLDEFRAALENIKPTVRVSGNQAIISDRRSNPIALSISPVNTTTYGAIRG